MVRINVEDVQRDQPDASVGDNTEVFVRELTECQDEMLVFIRVMCGNHHLASDIRQAVNMVLWGKRKSFVPGTNFRGWAYRIAQFEVKAHLRRLKRENTTSFTPALLDLIAAELPEVLDELPERRLALARCMENLTPKDSQLIHHRYWHNGSLDQLARATGRSVGTLKARLFQLRAALRNCVRQHLPEIQA